MNAPMIPPTTAIEHMIRIAPMKTGISVANPVTMNIKEYASAELKKAAMIPFLRSPKIYADMMPTISGAPNITIKNRPRLRRIPAATIAKNLMKLSLDCNGTSVTIKPLLMFNIAWF